MAQIQKKHIKRAIIEAALQTFAKQGFSNASIAEIAAHSGVSTGNIYRYFKSKKKLFETVIPSSLTKTFLGKLRKRVAAYPIGTHPSAIAEGASYSLFSEELLDFVIANRLQVLTLLEGASGTDYASFSKKLYEELTSKLIGALELNKTNNSVILRTLIEKLYENFLQAIGTILRQFSDAEEVRSAVQFLTAYHLGGLANLKKENV